MTITDEKTSDVHIALFRLGEARIAVLAWLNEFETQVFLFRQTERMELFRYPNVMKSLTKKGACIHGPWTTRPLPCGTALMEASVPRDA